MGTPFSTTAPAPAAGATLAASDGQLAYVTSLLTERDWSDGPDKHVRRAAALKTTLSFIADPNTATADIMGDGAKGDQLNRLLAHMVVSATSATAYIWAPLTRRGASALIEWLTSLPRRQRVIETQGQWDEDERRHDLHVIDVPAGRYAIDTQVHAVNGTAFYKVDRPDTGRWAGHVFVKQIVGSDEQKLSQKQAKGILSRIAAAGAEAASARYGHEIGECGVCGRQLTNDESRERGIGPVCVQKMGW